MRSGERWRVNEVILLAGHAPGEVLDFAAARRCGPPRVTCHVERSPQGTIGALRLVEQQLADEFLLVLGDVLPPRGHDIWGRLAAVLARTGSAAVMATAAAHESLDRGNVSAEGDLVTRYDKNAELPLIDRGTRLLSRSALARFAGNSDEEFFAGLVRSRVLAHCMLPGTVLDIGTPDRLALTRRLLRERSAHE